MDDDDHKSVPLIRGWSFEESSRQNGISYYVLMSPSGLTGSEEYHEDELKGLIRYNETWHKVQDCKENLLIGIGMGWDLDGLFDAYKKAVAEHKQNEKDSRPVLTS